MLTTIDNPWHPFTNFDEWMTYDHEMGYDTLCYLDRIANASEELSDNDYDAAILEGMKEICELNVLGIYKLIHKDDVEKLVDDIATIFLKDFYADLSKIREVCDEYEKGDKKRINLYLARQSWLRGCFFVALK